MSMKLSDRAFAKSRGTAEQAIAFARKNGAKRIPDFEDYAREVYRLCALAGMDASLVIAQSHLETGGWGAMGYNKWWEEYLNPAGMGIPSDPRYIEPHDFKTGENAARAQVVHLAVYATGGVPDALKQYQDADFRLDDYYAAFGRTAVARTIDEFGSGKWAEDPQYSEKWVGRGNQIFPNLPDQEAGTTPPKPQPGKRVTRMEILYGGKTYGIDQAYGPTDWAAQNPSMYAYATGYLFPGEFGGRPIHPGVDRDTPDGAPIYSPFDGTVTTAGGTPYFVYNQRLNVPGEGHFVLTLDNKDEFVLGHLKKIVPKVGTRLKVGDLIGYGGGYWPPNDKHTHEEYRAWTPGKTEHGRHLVDPNKVLSEVITVEGEGGGVELPSAKHWTAIPGLPGGKLGTDYPIRVRLIPNQYRVNRKALTPRRSVAHGTANASNDSAWNEMGYFVSGAEGRGVSVHYCADHRELVVGLPLDEQGVHAGDSFGNQHGFACELIEATATWNDPSKRDRLIYIAADAMGRTAARLGVENPNRHSDYGNPSCPAKLQANGGQYWKVYERIWRASRADELKRMQGPTGPTGPTGLPKPTGPTAPPKPTGPTGTTGPTVPSVPKPRPDDSDGWSHER